MYVAYYMIDMIQLTDRYGVAVDLVRPSRIVTQTPYTGRHVAQCILVRFPIVNCLQALQRKKTDGKFDRISLPWWRKGGGGGQGPFTGGKGGGDESISLTHNLKERV